MLNVSRKFILHNHLFNFNSYVLKIRHPKSCMSYHIGRKTDVYNVNRQVHFRLSKEVKRIIKCNCGKD